MTIIIPRRKLLTGFGALLAAPAIVRAESLMKLPRPEIVRPTIEVLMPQFNFVTGNSVVVHQTAGYHDDPLPLRSGDGSSLATGDLIAGQCIRIRLYADHWRIIA